jgi:hypothetical protein
MAAFATSYIPTVASQVTRSADSASMTGANFSSWYRANEGTFYSEQLYYSTTTTTFTTWQTNLSGTNAMFAYNYGGTIATNAPTGAIDNGAVTANTFVKYSVAYTPSSLTASKNGATVVTGSATIVIPNQLFIGSNNNTNLYLNGNIKKLAYYPKRLTNAELQGVTTV